MLKGEVPNGKKVRTMGRMPNVIECYAEQAECQMGAMLNGPNA